MAKVPNPVPKGGRKPDAALADNVRLDPNSVAERAAPGPAKGHRPAGSGRLKISQCQPRLDKGPVSTDAAVIEYAPVAEGFNGPDCSSTTLLAAFNLELDFSKRLVKHQGVGYDGHCHTSGLSVIVI